jgi:hypothetical protein
VVLIPTRLAWCTALRYSHMCISDLNRPLTSSLGHEFMHIRWLTFPVFMFCPNLPTYTTCEPYNVFSIIVHDLACWLLNPFCTFYSCTYHYFVAVVSYGSLPLGSAPRVCNSQVHTHISVVVKCSLQKLAIPDYHFMSTFKHLGIHYTNLIQPFCMHMM